MSTEVPSPLQSSNQSNAEECSAPRQRLEIRKRAQEFAEQYNATAAVLPGTPGATPPVFLDRRNVLERKLKELIPLLEAAPPIDPILLRDPRAIAEVHAHNRAVGIRPTEIKDFENYRQATLKGYQETDPDFLRFWPLKEVNEQAQKMTAALQRFQGEPITLQGLTRIERQVNILQNVLNKALARVEQKQEKGGSPTATILDAALEESLRKHQWDVKFNGWIDAIRKEMQEKRTFLEQAEQKMRARPRQIYDARDLEETDHIREALKNLSRPDPAKIAHLKQQQSQLKQKIDIQTAELQKRFRGQSIPDELPPLSAFDRVRETVRGWWCKVRKQPFQPVEQVFKELKANRQRWDKQEQIIHSGRAAHVQEFLNDPDRIVERRSIIRAQTQELKKGLETMKFGVDFVEDGVIARKQRKQLLERLQSYQHEYEHAYKPIYEHMAFSEQSLVRSLKEQLDEGQRWLKEYQRTTHRRCLQLLESLEKPRLTESERKRLERLYAVFAEEEWMSKLSVEPLKKKLELDRKLGQLRKNPANFRFLAALDWIERDFITRGSHAPKEEDIVGHLSFLKLDPHEQEEIRRLLPQLYHVKQGIAELTKKQKQELIQRSSKNDASRRRKAG